MARAKRPSGVATPAVAELLRLGVSHSTHSYEHDPAHPSYGLEAAEALGVDPSRVFKTLVVQADGELAFGIVPVPCRLDLKALASALGAKRCEMAPPELAERRTGYVTGGISPLGQRSRLRTVLDASALEHGTIHVSGGRRGFEVELAPADLVHALTAFVSVIARD
ncbi:Cys-tRNA(Pro) deacylase [Naasia lichenicola]|uniref:Cys-tRNA(Pro)/Cys-tRNA(Cys) deacylase n=1 Tax=Naasia lichenicola TaxID=2565933 RepID=A0A4S4FSV0_9MICO|nr:Cys-tRNA(Pro) deacylase [Naasia lichenicola]THG33494.1 Cys-tRNA(Pro) deacylase [Naasia lichenicola]